MAPPAATTTTVNYETQQDALKSLLQLFSKLKKNAQDLNDAIQELEHQFVELDYALGKDIEAWNQHNNIFVEQLISELATQGVNLSEFEKEQLNHGLKTISEIRNEIRAQGRITLPVDATRFRIKTISALIAAMARTFNKIDSSSINSTINKLNAISNESSSAFTLKKAQEQIYQQLAEKVKNTSAKVSKQFGLSSEEKEILNQSLRIVSPEKAPPPKPWVPTPIIK